MVGPQLKRNTAWWATFAGLVAFLAWQGFVLVIAALVFLGRASGRCLVGPECQLLPNTGDFFAGFIAVAALSLSLGILSGLSKLSLAFWKQNYWTGVVLRIVGIVTAIAGLFGFLLYGVVWMAIGLWIAFWSRRLALAGPPAPAGDPNVLEGERV